MADIGFKKLKEPLTINNSAEVKVTEMGHIVEVIHIARKSDTLNDYIKLDKESYMVVDRNTGEVEYKNYDLKENRSQNTEGLQRTFKRLRDLINNNFHGANNELFITLTYRLNEDGTPQNDVEKAAIDFDRFIKRFRRRYPDLQYIAVLEPQASSAWHWHLLARFDKWTDINSHIYIDNNEVIAPLWGHGFTSTKKLNHVNNIGAYLSAYLGNVEITEGNKEEIFTNVLNDGGIFEVIEKEVTDEDNKKVTKKFLKGARLHLYKSGVNIYRHSRSIVPPTPQKMTYAQAKQEIIGNKTPDYSRTVIIEDKKGKGENKRTYNAITYESYNLKREK